MKAYVKSETPQEIVSLFFEVLGVAKDTGKVKKGINEVTKSVERGNAKIIAMAMDVDPEEIMMHLPGLCEQKGVPYIYCRTKEELGKFAGLSVPTSAVSIEDGGNAKEKLRTLIERVTGKSSKEEKRSEEKPPQKQVEEKQEKPKGRKKKE